MEKDAHNRKISQARVLVERAIRRVKVFKILNGTIPICCEHLLSRMWKVCCRLIAFRPPLVNSEQF